MATRLYFKVGPPGNTGGITPAADAGWTDTTQFLRRELLEYDAFDPTFGIQSTSFNVSSTGTTNVLDFQFISNGVLPAGTISGTISFVMLLGQSVSTLNATLAFLLKVVSADGLTVRGTLFSAFGTDTTVALSGSETTRTIINQAVTPVVAQAGDFLVAEFGFHMAAASTTGTTSLYRGRSATVGDWDLTSGNTVVSKNAWVELSQDIWPKGIKSNRGLRPHPFSPGLAR